MIALLVLLAVVVFALVGVAFLLGFRLGGDRPHTEVARVRLEAAQASRRLHDLTRDAFVSMAQAAEERRSSS